MTYFFERNGEIIAGKRFHSNDANSLCPEHPGKAVEIIRLFIKPADIVIEVVRENNIIQGECIDEVIQLLRVMNRDTDRADFTFLLCFKKFFPVGPVLMFFIICMKFFCLFCAFC